MDKILNSRGLEILLKSDGKSIFRDPFFILMFAAPVLILLVVYIGVPILSAQLYRYLGFDLSSYYPLILSFMAAIPALLYGFVSGFMLLDDRDEKILLHIMITPFGIKRYFTYRILLLSMVSLIFSFVFLFFNPLCEVSLFRCAAVAMNVSFQSAAGALFLVIFARNKVEGLAKGKMMGIIFIGPLAAWFIPRPFHYLAAILPPYWNGMLIFGEGSPILFWLISIGIHCLLMFLILRRLNVSLSLG